MEVIVLVVIIMMLYFLPGIVASSRAHQNAGAIFVLNLFLGWTLLGWVIALVWACTAVKKPETPAAAATESQYDTKKCPVCAERVKWEAVRCRFCGYDFAAAKPS